MAGVVRKLYTLLFHLFTLDNILFPLTASSGPAFPSCELQLPISTQAHQPAVQPYFQKTYPDLNSDSPSPSSLQPAEVNVFKLTSNATKPTVSPTGAGMGLYSAYTYTVHSREYELIKTDIAVELPANILGKIFPKTDLELSNHLDVFPVILPFICQDNIKVSVCNFSGKTVIVTVR